MTSQVAHQAASHGLLVHPRPRPYSSVLDARSAEFVIHDPAMSSLRMSAGHGFVMTAGNLEGGVRVPVSQRE